MLCCAGDSCPRRCALAWFPSASPASLLLLPLPLTPVLVLPVPPVPQVDVDITSNTVANSVTSLVVGAITSLVVDLAPLVEGQVGA